MSYTLYGTPSSLYTGKARAYLIKQGLPFSQRTPGYARFREHVIPQVGRWIIPVLETEDGALVQDGSDIIRYFESRGLARWPAYPTTPRHRLVGHLFELFGGEGLLRPAMHYRWNFDHTHLAFLEQDFPSALAPFGAPQELRAQVFAMASHRMRSATARFGVTPETIPTVEAAYHEFLRLFDAHLAGSPYLLGGRPTLGDYGLIAPLHAHLGRDPVPSALMKRSAYRVWRWVERMNAPDLDAGEYGAPAPELFPEDHVPESLRALMRFVAEDYLPEVEAYVAFTNDWLAARPELQTGTSGLPRPQDRVLGMMSFPWRGHTLSVSVLPYRLYLLQQLQDGAAGAEALLEETGLSRLLSLRTARRVERPGHLEVWGPPVG